MKKILITVCVLACISTVVGSTSFRDVMAYWLTADKVVDFNKDGIVNLKDFALIGCYGSDEYGLDIYGR